VQNLASLSAGSATKANVISSLNAVKADLQKMKDAQPDLAPAHKQQVQNAVTDFGTQLNAIIRQTVAGLSKTDAQTQVKDAAASLASAVEKSLQPISC
jgi:citrate lyase gamma subunit